MMGCPACGGGRIKQIRTFTNFGNVVAVVALLLLIPSLGSSVLLLLFAYFFRKSLAKCKDCKWKWTP